MIDRGNNTDYSVGDIRCMIDNMLYSNFYDDAFDSVCEMHGWDPYEVMHFMQSTPEPAEPRLRVTDNEGKSYACHSITFGTDGYHARLESSPGVWFMSLRTGDIKSIENTI